MKLTADQIKSLANEGTYGDGNGLYLQIAPSGTKSWIYRYQISRRRRWMGLGGFPEISLAKARKLRDQHRLNVKAGIDPLEVKKENAAKTMMKRKQNESLKMTFQNCANDYMSMMESSWKNAKHAQQWRNTLKTYAYPIIGDLPIAYVELEHLLEILNPIWLTKTETASRLRNRIELVLNYAITRKYRSEDNPARWRGKLDTILPKPSKIKK